MIIALLHYADGRTLEREIPNIDRFKTRHLDDLTGAERELLEKGCKAMAANDRTIVMSKSRLKALNLQVGDPIKRDMFPADAAIVGALGPLDGL